jgi:hypothetical protein
MGNTNRFVGYMGVTVLLVAGLLGCAQGDGGGTSQDGAVTRSDGQVIPAMDGQVIPAMDGEAQEAPDSMTPQLQADGESPDMQNDGGPPDPSPGTWSAVQLSTTHSPSWVAWYEIEVYSGGENIAATAGVVTTGQNDETIALLTDGQEATSWNSGGFPPTSVTLTFDSNYPIERVRARVMQNPAGATIHHLSFGQNADDLSVVHTWRGETADGVWLEYRPQQPAAPRASSIFDAQRGAPFAGGEVRVQGNRFVIDDVVWYPKTDFLTLMVPGDDIINGTTHTYLGRTAEHRARIRQALMDHEYNAIYLYVLNQGDYRAGARNPAGVITPYGNGGWHFDTAQLNQGRVDEWRTALRQLMDETGVKPFIWLAADDSPDIAGASLDRWRTYVGHMVDAFEGLPIVWVLGLEVDEYWSDVQVRERREVLQSMTGHLVGVHLTIHETNRNRDTYTQGFDFVMGQLASPQDDHAYEQNVEMFALADRPWVASEFNVAGRDGAANVTARSQAIGRVIASVGTPPLVAGIGNGISLGNPPDDPPEPPAVPFDLNAVVWLHTNVSDWAVTADLSSVTFRGDSLCLEYDKKNVWQIEQVGADNVEIVSNPWIFIPHEGQWYGATWEWMRPGQTCKAQSSVAGDHIKQPPFDAASGWRPTSGVTYYFMVSAPARLGRMNVAERSNIVAVEWP